MGQSPQSRLHPVSLPLDHLQSCPSQLARGAQPQPASYSQVLTRLATALGIVDSGSLTTRPVSTVCKTCERTIGCTGITLTPLVAAASISWPHTGKSHHWLCPVRVPCDQYTTFKIFLIFFSTHFIVIYFRHVRSARHFLSVWALLCYVNKPQSPCSPRSPPLNYISEYYHPFFLTLPLHQHRPPLP